MQWIKNGISKSLSHMSENLIESLGKKSIGRFGRTYMSSRVAVVKSPFNFNSFLIVPIILSLQKQD